MKKLLSILIAVPILIALLPISSFAGSGVSLTGSNDVDSYYDHSNMLMPNIEVAASLNLSGVTIISTNLPEDCTISHSNISSPVNVHISDDNKIIKLTGYDSAMEYQKVLRGLKIKTGNTPATATFNVALGPDVFYNNINNHFYKYNSGKLTWNDARDNALSNSYFGLQGYLATVTSAQENKFVSSIANGRLWLGASDADTENTWKWVAGPEAGQIFWKDGNQISGEYSNFQTGQPDDDNVAGEDHLCILSNKGTPAEQQGKWNDFHAGEYSEGYIIEFGGLPGETIDDVSETFNVVIKAPKYTVDFDSHGGNNVSPLENITHGSKISEPSKPAKDGYIFEGWFETEEYKNEWNFSNDKIIENLTLHAKWSPRNDIPYKVEHYKKGLMGFGYELADTDNLLGSTDTIAYADAKIYDGFEEDTKHLQRVSSGKIELNGSLVLKLYYNRKYCVALFDKNTENLVHDMVISEMVYFEDYLIEPWEPYSEGLSFCGWYKDRACTDKWIFDEDLIKKDITLYAKWIKNKSVKDGDKKTVDEPSHVNTDVVVPNNKKNNSSKNLNVPNNQKQNSSDEVHISDEKTTTTEPSKKANTLKTNKTKEKKIKAKLLIASTGGVVGVGGASFFVWRKFIQK